MEPAEGVREVGMDKHSCEVGLDGEQCAVRREPEGGRTQAVAGDTGCKGT